MEDKRLNVHEHLQELIRDDDDQETYENFGD